MSESQKKTSFALPIAIMFALYFMIAFVTNFAGSMGVIVQNQFGASNAMSQLGTLANFIAYAFMGIPAGIILKRKGYKFTSLAAVVVGFVGVGIQWISGPMASFGVYVLGAFVAGFSMCMLNIVVNPMLNTLGGGGKKGNQLNQFGGTLNSLGGTIAPYFLGWLIGGEAATAQVSDAAPAMLSALGIFALAFVIIALNKIPEPHMETPEEKALRLSGNVQKDPHSALSFRHFVLGAIAIFFYVGCEVGIPNTANLYMSGMGSVGPAVAGQLVAFYWLAMLAGRLVIGGLFGSKIAPKSMLVTVATLAIVFVACLMFMPEAVTFAFGGSAVPVSMIFMVICGLCTSVMWPSIFNLSVEGLGKYTPMASGIFMALVCGGGILPFFQNLVADSTTLLTSYIVVIIGFAYILFYALIGSKNVNKDIKVD